MAEWYYAQHEEQFGPVTAAALKEMAQAGTLDRDDLIWREGMQRWAPARKVRGLFADETDPQSDDEQPSNVNGEAGQTSDPQDRVSDVVPVDDDESESGSVSGDGETAIDVLPLAGPEESKLHMPVLTTPDDPSSDRSASNDIVVFEPASPPPAPPKLRPKAENTSAQQDSGVARQTRIDVPQAAGGSWLVGLGLFAQVFTMVSCLLVVIIGGAVYLGTLLYPSGTDPLVASGIYAAFVLASYCLARTTERICRIFGVWFNLKLERTSKRTVRERNRQRFQ